MQVQINSSYLDPIVLDFSDKTTVGDLKALIEKDSGFKKEKQVLKFNDNLLDDSVALREYGIKHGSQLELSLNS